MADLGALQGCPGRVLGLPRSYPGTLRGASGDLPGHPGAPRHGKPPFYDDSCRDSRCCIVNPYNCHHFSAKSGDSCGASIFDCLDRLPSLSALSSSFWVRLPPSVRVQQGLSANSMLERIQVLQNRFRSSAKRCGHDLPQQLQSRADLTGTRRSPPRRLYGHRRCGRANMMLLSCPCCCSTRRSTRSRKAS